MIEFPNGGLLVEQDSELPRFEGRDLEIVADFETTSGDDALDSLNPWHHCRAAGVAVRLAGARSPAYYVPVGHRRGPQVSRPAFVAWWRDLLSRTKRWKNHNVKYDAHVSANDLGVAFEGELDCTQTRAKILDSDRGFGRGGYGLDALSLSWLGDDIRPFEAAMKARLGKSKDYGSLEPGSVGEYACQDVLTTDRLDAYLSARTPAECAGVVELERALTPVLVEMERNGMRTRRELLMAGEYEELYRQNMMHAELQTLLGRAVNPRSGDDVYDVLCCQFGLPVVKWTNLDEDERPTGKSNPSFDKHAMVDYLSFPGLDPRQRRAVELIAEYRQSANFTSMFLHPYQELLGADGRLHPNYNQCLRTGRMGCVDPNAQQLNKRAKELIEPEEEEAFLSFDQSQIEFRVIVHYINDRRCIAAYAADPDTDFHQWMADTASMKRKPAKTLNFQNGYGGGRKRAVLAMSRNADVVGHLMDQVLANVDAEHARRPEVTREALVSEMFAALAKQKGEDVYDAYHRALPTLKPTSRRAAAVCADRGYVFNLHGRRRHLPADHAHNAFNSLCQGEAADIQKERTVAVARAIRGTPIKMVANVHDETLLEGPEEVMADPRTQAAIAWMLETPDVKLRVPLRVSVGLSRKHWREACTDVKDGGASAPLKYELSSIDRADPLRHLRG